jgi:hypothetical protein
VAAVAVQAALRQVQNITAVLPEVEAVLEALVCTVALLTRPQIPVAAAVVVQLVKNHPVIIILPVMVALVLLLLDTQNKEKNGALCRNKSA